MVQDVHHMGSANPCRVVQPCVLEAPAFQVLDTPVGVGFHVILGAEYNGSGRAGFHAGGLQPHRYSVGAQGALVGLLILLRNAGNVERTTGNAVAAANAVILVEVDNTVIVLNDGAGTGAGLETARIRAVHTAVLADQPFQIAIRGFVFLKPHHGPGVLGQVRGVIVDADVPADLIPDVVPFHTCDLTGLTANAHRGVDQLGDLVVASNRRSGLSSGGAGDNVMSSHSYTFSTLTRNDLNSGVLVLPSPTNGVRVLVM